jgi:hypothetical protein
MLNILKHIPRTSFTNLMLESKMPYKSNINYILKKQNHFEYAYINSQINFKLREHENYLINEYITLKLNTRNNKLITNYSHKIYYNDMVFGHIKFGKHKPTLWTNFNSSIKKLYYEINFKN